MQSRHGAPQRAAASRMHAPSARSRRRRRNVKGLARAGASEPQGAQVLGKAGRSLGTRDRNSAPAPAAAAAAVRMCLERMTRKARDRRHFATRTAARLCGHGHCAHTLGAETMSAGDHRGGLRGWAFATPRSLPGPSDWFPQPRFESTRNASGDETFNLGRPSRHNCRSPHLSL